MHIKRIAATIGTAAMLAGLGMTTAASASSTGGRVHTYASQATGHAGHLPVMLGYNWRHGTIRPGKLFVPDAVITHIRWSQWSSVAYGKGVFFTGPPGHTFKGIAYTALTNVKTHKGLRYYANWKTVIYTMNGHWAGKILAVVRHGNWVILNSPS